MWAGNRSKGRSPVRCRPTGEGKKLRARRREGRDAGEQQGRRRTRLGILVTQGNSKAPEWKSGLWGKRKNKVSWSEKREQRLLERMRKVMGARENVPRRRAPTGGLGPNQKKNDENYVQGRRIFVENNQ